MDRAAAALADRVFLETTRRFAAPRLAGEDVRAALELSQVEPGKPVADLGCGYGRHLKVLHQQGYERALGIDRSALLLAEAQAEAPHALLVEADLTALPLHGRSLAAAFCFYSSMFLGSHADALQALREAARVLREGGTLVLTTDNPVRLAANPSSHFEEDVPGLGRVIETSRYDPRENVDQVTKTICRRGGEELSATFRIRYYLPAQLAELAAAAGLGRMRLYPDAELTEATPQLVARLEKTA
ncbi:MAG TPA: class I SAM-dependent methyltransferase [Myxococcales bacterium]|nr:class I SAM-dependent methyltransferase [Myxococcales bacterium]